MEKCMTNPKSEGYISAKDMAGRVARWQGQQRVAVVMEELVTVVTAYVPSAFLEKMNN